MLGILAYWAIGWALAFGPNPHASLDPFFGFSQFFINGLQDYAKFFFQFVFAATASVWIRNITISPLSNLPLLFQTIISGAVAERAEFACFLTYSIMITGKFVNGGRAIVLIPYLRQLAFPTFGGLWHFGDPWRGNGN